MSVPSIVFEVNPNNNKTRVLVLFLLSGIVGLDLIELLAWVGVDALKFNYMLVKIGATAAVMACNFITRKLFLEKQHTTKARGNPLAFCYA